MRTRPNIFGLEFLKKLQTAVEAFVILLLLWPEFIWAAACCGGGFASPTLISTDDKSILTTSLSYQQIVVNNIDTQGFWRKWPSVAQSSQIMRIEGGRIVADRWQVGVSTMMIQRTRNDQQFSGLGDIAGSLGYEFLPDWDYNPYRPKGLAFMQVTLPTGKSRAESEDGGLDSRGNGFWAFGLGSLLTKSWGRWDAFTLFEMHQSFSKSVSTSQFQGVIRPGRGGQVNVGGGYSWNSLRLGSSVAWIYEDPLVLTGSITSPGAIERYATLNFIVSYLFTDEWATSLSYSDQTVVGNPFNTSLSRGLSLQIQRRWAR